MAKEVTGRFSVVYDTLEEYEADVLNVVRYKDHAPNPDVQDEVLDEQNLTISYKIIEVI